MMGFGEAFGGISLSEKHFFSREALPQAISLKKLVNGEGILLISGKIGCFPPKNGLKIQALTKTAQATPSLGKVWYSVHPQMAETSHDLELELL